MSWFLEQFKTKSGTMATVKTKRFGTIEQHPDYSKRILGKENIEIGKKYRCCSNEFTEYEFIVKTLRNDSILGPNDWLMDIQSLDTYCFPRLFLADVGVDPYTRGGTHYSQSYFIIPLDNVAPKGVSSSCPDCKGTGTYIGFLSVENCKTCRG